MSNAVRKYTSDRCGIRGIGSKCQAAGEVVGLGLLKADNCQARAFGEEMAWRGYLMNRIADLGKHTRLAWIVSLVTVNVAFGYAHSYQGITGIIDEGLMGVLLGVLYLGTGCNLSVPIIAHGIADTVDLLLIFSGKYPGMGR